MGMAMKDIAPRHRDFVGVRVIAENSLKHVRALCFTPTGMEALAEMKQVFPGNWLSIGFTAHGPLRWTNLALDIFLKSSGHGIPATINGEPMAGATGPVSLAGSIAVGNAEILAGIVVNQILEPGRPLIYNLGLAHIFDMKFATAVTGGPENALFAKASAAMGRFYGLPSGSWVSTESMFDDAQAALEKMFGFHTHMAEGVSLIWGMGQLESEKTISLAQLVLDNEMIEYVRRYQRGFEVNSETLQFELIKKVGIGGSFLETDHTLLSYREHFWMPSILNRRTRETCKGRLEDVARAEAERILGKDEGIKISQQESAELRRIEQHYAEKIGVD
jgi:trimethylamine--corrinoid protein Co-methyltransferase